MSDLIKASKACSPETLDKLKKHYIDHSNKLSELGQLPQTKSTKAAIRKIEQTLNKIRPFIPLGTQEAGASSVRVQAPGLAGEQGEKVDVDQKTYAVKMGSGAVRHVTVNVTDKTGKPLPQDAIQKEVRNQAHQIATFESEVGVTRAPSRRTEELSTQIGRGTRSEAEKRAPLTAKGEADVAKQTEQRLAKETARTAAINKIKESGKAGAHLEGVSKGKRKFTVVLEDGSEHSGTAPGGMSQKEGKAHVIKLVKEGIQADAASVEEEAPVRRDVVREPETRKEAKKEAPKPITSVSDLPDHREDEGLIGSGHTLENKIYRGEVSKFYRKLDASIENTRLDKRRSLLRDKKGGKISNIEYKDGLREADRNAAEIKDEIRSRQANVHKDHAAIVFDAHERGAKDINEKNIEQYDLEGKQKEEPKDVTIDSLLRDLVGRSSLRTAQKGQKVTNTVREQLSPLRQALGLGDKESLEDANLDQITDKLRSLGVGPLPTEIKEGETAHQVLEEREVKGKFDIGERNLELEKYKTELTDSGIKGKEYKRLVDKKERKILIEKEKVGRQRGQTTEEGKNKKHLLDWVSNIKNNIRRYLDSVIKHHGTAEDFTVDSGLMKRAQAHLDVVKKEKRELAAVKRPEDHPDAQAMAKRKDALTTRIQSVQDNLSKISAAAKKEKDKDRRAARESAIKRIKQKVVDLQDKIPEIDAKLAQLTSKTSIDAWRKKKQDVIAKEQAVADAHRQKASGGKERAFKEIDAEFQSIIEDLEKQLFKKWGGSLHRTEGASRVHSVPAVKTWGRSQRRKEEWFTDPATGELSRKVRPSKTQVSSKRRYENPVFDILSVESQNEVRDKLTNIKKSVIDNLNPSRKILMSGLFLGANLFKALNLSEKHKIEKFKNSFGQGTSGVNPASMNSVLHEKDEEEKEDEDEETRKSLNLGFYVSC